MTTYRGTVSRAGFGAPVASYGASYGAPITMGTSRIMPQAAPAVRTIGAGGTTRIISSGGVAGYGTSGGVASYGTTRVISGGVASYGAPQVVTSSTISPFAAPVEVVQEVVQEVPQLEKMALFYWPIFAKGMASAIALELGGFAWEIGAGPGSKGTGDLWGEWLEMKPSTVWAFLPNLAIGGGEQIGSELAILQFLARQQPLLAGADDAEFRFSQELLHQSEELYQKIGAKVPTIMEQDKNADDFVNFWTNDDRNSHSSKQGLPVYLAQLDSFLQDSRLPTGPCTSSRITIGEIKLYATLVILVMLDSTILTNYPGLTDLYMRFDQDEAVRRVLDGSGWQQYFILPPAAEAPAEGDVAPQ